MACKAWNGLPADDVGLTGNSYDNTGALSATTWRHVAFVKKLTGEDGITPQRHGGTESPGEAPVVQPGVMPPFQSNWLIASDVCKH